MKCPVNFITRKFLICLLVLIEGLILVPNGKYLGRLLGDQYPANFVDDAMDEPAGPGGRMLDLSHDNTNNGPGIRSNLTNFDYRSVL